VNRVLQSRPAPSGLRLIAELRPPPVTSTEVSAFLGAQSRAGPPRDVSTSRGGVSFAVVKYWTLVGREPVPGTPDHGSWIASVEEVFADLTPVALAMVAAGHLALRVAQ
jgi:hypothetical protein